MRSAAPNLLVACLLLAAARPAAADDAKTFRYKMEKGTPLIYRLTTESKQTQSIGGMNIESEVANDDVSIRTLERVDDDGNFVIQSENKILKAKLSAGPAGDYKYDSQSPDNEKGSVLGSSLTPLYDTLKGAFVHITVSPRGDVVNVKGLSDLLKDVLKDNPLAAQFGMMGSDEGAALSYGDSFVEFPDKPLKPGDTWKVPFELDIPKMGTFKGSTTYKFEGMEKRGERETAKISETSEMSLELNIESDAANVTGTISSTEGTGTAYFDPELGQIVSKKSNMKLNGNLTVTAGGQNLALQQDQSVASTVELLDKLPE